MDTPKLKVTRGTISLDGILATVRTAAKAKSDMAAVIAQQLVAQLGVSADAAESMIETLEPSTIAEMLKGAQSAQAASPIKVAAGTPAAPPPIDLTKRIVEDRAKRKQ